MDFRLCIFHASKNAPSADPQNHMAPCSIFVFKYSTTKSINHLTGCFIVFFDMDEMLVWIAFVFIMLLQLTERTIVGVFCDAAWFILKMTLRCIVKLLRFAVGRLCEFPVIISHTSLNWSFDLIGINGVY